MSIESQFQHPQRSSKEYASAKNQEILKHLSAEDAIEMYKEKHFLVSRMVQNINDISENDDGILRSHDIAIKIHKICFADVEQSELVQHVMHRVISGATIVAEMEDENAVFIYDELDRDVEKHLQQFCDVSKDVQKKSEEILKLEQALIESVHAMETTH